MFSHCKIGINLFAVALTVLVAFTGCKRETTISGRLMIDCDSPNGHTRLVFYQKRAFPFAGHWTRVGVTKTDAEGYFIIDLETRRNASFKMSYGSVDFDGIPASRQDVNLEEVPRGFNYHVYMQLNVANNYSDTDTLYYKIDNVWKKVGGDFQDGQIIDSLDNLYYENRRFTRNRSFMNKVEYYINDPLNKQEYSFTVDFCDKNWIKVNIPI